MASKTPTSSAREDPAQADPAPTDPTSTDPTSTDPVRMDPVRMDEVADVRRGVTRLVQRMRVSRGPGALSTNKLVVLGHLHRFGPTTPGSLAAAEHQQPQSLTRVFTELEKAGMVSRSRDASDHRRSVIAITPIGLEALRRDMSERDRWLATAMSGLSETEQGLLHLAGRLMDSLANVPPTPPLPEADAPPA